MSQTESGIVAYLDLLHANRHLIAAAYCNGGVNMDDDNQRKIRQLQQHRVLIPYHQDDFRLSPSFGRHLDEVFQRQRSYAVGANFGELINRLPQLIDEYVNASHEGRLEGQEEYAADFDVGVFELASLIENELLGLRVITENQFSNVTTLAEKRRQNEFYLNRAEKIGGAITLVEGENLLGKLAESTLLKPLFAVYQHQIQAKLKDWRATHMGITQILKEFLYRLRHVEPNARRIRAFAHFLRKTPDYQPPEVEVLQSLPSWASRFAGLRIKTHPDLSLSQARDDLADVARSIQSAKISITSAKQRVAGRLVGNGVSKVVSVISQKPAQIAFQRYVDAASASNNPLSALGWKRQQMEFAGLNDKFWLLYVNHFVQMGAKGKLTGFQFKRYEASPRYPRDGNIGFTDVELWKKL